MLSAKWIWFKKRLHTLYCTECPEKEPGSVKRKLLSVHWTSAQNHTHRFLGFVAFNVFVLLILKSSVQRRCLNVSSECKTACVCSSWSPRQIWNTSRSGSSWTSSTTLQRMDVPPRCSRCGFSVSKCFHTTKHRTSLQSAQYQKAKVVWMQYISYSMDITY